MRLKIILLMFFTISIISFSNTEKEPWTLSVAKWINSTYIEAPMQYIDKAFKATASSDFFNSVQNDEEFKKTIQVKGKGKNFVEMIQNVLKPSAYCIIVILVIISIMNQQMNETLTFSGIIKTIIIGTFASYLVENSMNVIMIMNNIANNVISAMETPKIFKPDDLDKIIKSSDNLYFQIQVLQVIFIISLLTMLALTSLIFVVISRTIKLISYAAISPLYFAMFASTSTMSIGVGFIKTYLLVGLEVIFIYIGVEAFMSVAKSYGGNGIDQLIAILVASLGAAIVGFSVKDIAASLGSNVILGVLGKAIKEKDGENENQDIENKEIEDEETKTENEDDTEKENNDNKKSKNTEEYEIEKLEIETEKEQENQKEESKDKKKENKSEKEREKTNKNSTTSGIYETRKNNKDKIKIINRETKEDKEDKEDTIEVKKEIVKIKDNIQFEEEHDKIINDKIHRNQKKMDVIKKTDVKKEEPEDKIGKVENIETNIYCEQKEENQENTNKSNDNSEKEKIEIDNNEEIEIEPIQSEKENINEKMNITEKIKNEVIENSNKQQNKKDRVVKIDNNKILELENQEFVYEPEEPEENQNKEKENKHSKNKDKINQRKTKENQINTSEIEDEETEESLEQKNKYSVNKGKQNQKKVKDNNKKTLEMDGNEENTYKDEEPEENSKIEIKENKDKKENQEELIKRMQKGKKIIDNTLSFSKSIKEKSEKSMELKQEFDDEPILYKDKSNIDDYIKRKRKDKKIEENEEKSEEENEEKKGKKDTLQRENESEEESEQDNKLENKNNKEMREEWKDLKN